MTRKECLDILEVPVGASRDEIVTAYRHLAQVWHPDRFHNNKELQKKAHVKLSKINEAYSALIDGGATPDSPAPSPATAPQMSKRSDFGVFRSVLCLVAAVSLIVWWNRPQSTVGPQSSHNTVDPFPSSLPRDITSKSTGMKLTLIPAGTFTMGSPAGEAMRSTHEGPQHSVRITQPFYMGVYEVTQAEYESVMGTNPSPFSKTGGRSSMVSGMDTGKFPVDRVSWDDAVEFCRKLSLKDGQTYRLPTEAEWEYACRANMTTPFHFGRTLNGDNANVDGSFPYGTTTKGQDLQRTTTVGAYAKNDFGLYDMHGNVREWCEDMYDGSAYGKRSGTTSDPNVTSGSTNRVLRGGSWFDSSWEARSANRFSDSPDWPRPSHGFRVVFSASAVRTP